MNKESESNWSIILLLIALVSFLIFAITMLFSRKEEDYEYLLEKRDRLHEELLKLKSKNLEGEIDEQEYRKLAKKYLKELQNIDAKLERMEKISSRKNYELPF